MSESPIAIAESTLVEWATEPPEAAAMAPACDSCGSTPLRRYWIAQGFLLLVKQRDAMIAALGFADDVAVGRDPVEACTEMRGCYINALDQYSRADRAEHERDDARSERVAVEKVNASLTELLQAAEKERDEWREIAERTSAELSKEERMSHELRTGLDEAREAHRCSVEMGDELVRAASKLTTERDNQSELIRNLHDTEAVLERDLLDARTRLAAPIPMRLICPACNALHVDEGWDGADKPHHTHACQGCGAVWRPAIVPTVGVRFLPGFKNQGATK